MNNDWRDYQKKNSDDSLEHSWGTSPEQKAKERAYNHRYWVENRERIIRQRASRAAGRDFESELRNERETQRHLESDRRHDYWNASREAQGLRETANNQNQMSEQYLNELEGSGNLVRLGNGGVFSYNPNTIEGQLASTKMGLASGYGQAARDNNTAATSVLRNARESGYRNAQQQAESRLRQQDIQREYDNAVKAYQSTPVARVQNIAATAVEAGRQAITAALDAVSNVAYSVVSRFKKK